jgi:hypothetical protein
MYVDDADKPEWYPYSLALRAANADDEWYGDEPNKKGMAYVMDGMINSPNKDITYDSMAANTSVPLSFSINAWNGFRPIVNNFPPFNPEIRMGLLPPVSFKLYIKNNLASNVVLSQLTVSFKFNYNSNAALMCIGSAVASEFCQMYCGPKKMDGDSTDGLTGPDRELWAILDGYDLSEVVKVYGYFDKWNDVKKRNEPQVVVLLPVEETGGSNFPPVVYKSKAAVIPKFDNDRMIYRGFHSGENAWPVTQKELCMSTKFKNVTVISAKLDVGTLTYSYCSPNDENAGFYVFVELRNDIEETTVEDGLTQAEFDAAMKTMRYFNLERTYVQSVSPTHSYLPGEAKIAFSRKQINKVFYDTLYDTFENVLVLTSQRDDCEPFVNIRINQNQLSEPLGWIPMYDGKPLMFHESLAKCSDGVRCRDILFFGTKDEGTPHANVIEIDYDTKKPYDVMFTITVSEYENMHVHQF